MGRLTHYANPVRFSKVLETILPFCGASAAGLYIVGLYFALVSSPSDYQQRETVRLMYIHVPAAWIGLGVYVAMAIAAGVGLVLPHMLADIFCVAAVPVGALLAGLCLVTGSLWGKPTWGTWWVWDARLTSVLILFLLYCRYIALRHAFSDRDFGSRVGFYLVLMGVVDIPIIKFSVDWWNTLHQPASVFRAGGPTIDPSMMQPLLVMTSAFAMGTFFMIMQRMNATLIKRKISRARDAE